MKGTDCSREGIQRLIVIYRRRFRTEENLAYYHPEDLAKAERRYIKFALCGHRRGPQESMAR